MKVKGAQFFMEQPHNVLRIIADRNLGGKVMMGMKQGARRIALLLLESRDRVVPMSMYVS